MEHCFAILVQFGCGWSAKKQDNLGRLAAHFWFRAIRDGVGGAEPLDSVEIRLARHAREMARTLGARAVPQGAEPDDAKAARAEHEP